METQNNLSSVPSPIPPQQKKWYWHKGILTIVILAIITIVVAYLYSFKKNFDLYNATGKVEFEDYTKSHAAAPFNGDKVYSVKEAVQILQSNPEQFKGKSVKIQGYYANAVMGIGCGDYIIIMDKDDAETSKSISDRLFKEFKTLNETEKKNLQEQLQKLPSLTSGQTLSENAQSIFPTQYAIYVGHFYDDWATKSCGANGWKRFVIDSKEKEIVSDKAPSHKTETITTGLVISNGKYINKPYEVKLQDYKVTINGILYEPPTEDQVNKITEFTDQQRQQQYDGLVSQLKNNRLIIYGGNKYESYIAAYSPTLISDIDALMKSNKPKAQKREDLAKLLNTFPEDTTLNDILNKWGMINKSASQDTTSPAELTLKSGDLISEIPAKVTFPTELKLIKHTNEPNAAGSVANYAFEPQNNETDAVSLNSVFIFTEQSVNDFDKVCKQAEQDNSLCYFGQYPTPESFKAEKNALQQKKGINGLIVQSFNGRDCLVGNEKVEGDVGYFRTYATYINDKRVEISIYMLSVKESSQQNQVADKLFASIKLQ